jgi:hypothetical protein
VFQALILKSFKAKQLDIAVDMTLGYNSGGALSITLPQGPQYDGNRFTIVVKIIDETDGVTTYTIDQKVEVIADDVASAQIIDDLLNGNTGSSFNAQLYSGDLRGTAEVVNNLISVINSQSYLSKLNYVYSSKTNS